MDKILKNVFSFDYDTGSDQVDYQQQVEALSASLSQLSEDDPSRMGLLFVRGNIKRELGLLRGAEADYDASLLWMVTHGRENSLMQAVVLIEKADCLLDGSYVEEAEAALAHALAILDRKGDEKQRHYLHALNKVGRLYASISLPERAIVLHKRVWNALSPQDIDLQASTFLHLGAAYFVQEDYETALSYFRQAEELVSGLQNVPGGRLVYTRYLLAETYACLGDVEAAQAANKRALALAENVYGVSSQPLSRLHMQAGRLVSSEDEATAVAAYRRALDEAFSYSDGKQSIFNEKLQDS